jgi:hypothetical protein
MVLSTCKPQNWEISMLCVGVVCLCVCETERERESLDVRVCVSMPQYNFQLVERF